MFSPSSPTPTLSARAGSTVCGVTLVLGLSGLITSDFSLLFSSLLLGFTALALEAVTTLESLYRGEPAAILERIADPQSRQAWQSFPDARRYQGEVIEAEYVEVVLER